MFPALRREEISIQMSRVRQLPRLLKTLPVNIFLCPTKWQYGIVRIEVHGCPPFANIADLAISQGALGYRQTSYPGKKIDDPLVHAEIYRNINAGYNYYVKSADDTIDFYYSNQGFHYGQDAFVIEQSWVQDGEVGETGVYYNYYDRDGSITVVDPRTHAAVHCVGSENPPAPTDPEKTYTAGVTGAVFTKVDVPGWKYAWQDPDGTIWSNYLGDFSNTPLGSESTNQILDSDVVRACKSVGGTVPSLEDYRRLNSYLDTYAYCSYNLSTQGNHDMKALFPDFDGRYFWSSTSGFTNAINQGSFPDEALGIQGSYDPNASAEFAQGAIYSKPRSEHQAVRCIRKLP